MAEPFHDWKKIQNQVKKKTEKLHKKSTKMIQNFNSKETT